MQRLSQTVSFCRVKVSPDVPAKRHQCEAGRESRSAIKRARVLYFTHSIYGLSNDSADDWISVALSVP